ncbi:MAG: FAD-dependent oxidoreductase [Sciscionella sp.]
MAATVDVLVVGLGPGGEALAGDLAAAGLSVVGIESRLVCGECPYYGCIPSKMMIRAADALAETRRVPQLAGESRVTPDFSPVAARIRDEAITNWDDAIAVDRLRSSCWWPPAAGPRWANSASRPWAWTREHGSSTPTSTCGWPRACGR